MLKMREKNIDFILDIDPVIPQSLQIDATRLRQVLFNLIGNAVKFTEQGHIRVIARTANENKIRSKLELRIDIEDTGIGISEDQQKIVFNDFEQSSGQDIRKYGGTGLGLSISKRLVNLMGGEITLKSELGKGSTFSINLTDVHVAPLAVEVDKEKIRSNSYISFLPATILIVDDIADNRDLLLANFAETNLKTELAENGLQAVKLAKAQPFDLILMDIRMPVMNGYEAAREIKLFSDVPIVALTASVMTDEFERLKSENFSGYLRKPVLKVDLTRELCKFLPFEEKANADDTVSKAQLLDSEREYLVPALDRLEKMTEQCFDISKNNNISAIQIFADMVLEISHHYPISVIADYAKQLKHNADSFDIAAIKRSLRDYPQLIRQLKDLGETGKLK
jgi:two-component system sensor histidine kinase EvgS